MASEYFLKLAREQAPPEPPRELTKAEKRRNWWHYHKWWVVAAVVLLGIVGSMLWNILGIGKTKPDYIFAYVGGAELEDSLAEALTGQLEALGEDVNGDGTVKVELRQYAIRKGGDSETTMYYNYAADTKLLADITKGESYFFLTDDPRGMQQAYELFAGPDGSPPEDGDRDVSDKVFAWSACPTLAGLDLDQSAVQGLWLGRRCFYGSDAEGREADDALWQILVKEAKR